MPRKLPLQGSDGEYAIPLWESAGGAGPQGLDYGTTAPTKWLPVTDDSGATRYIPLWAAT